MFKKKFEKTDIFILSFLVLLALAVVFSSLYERSKLEKKHLITTGLIYDWESGGKSSPGSKYINYEFYLGSKKIKGERMYSNESLKLSFVENYLINKYFPIVYSPEYPKNSAILITPKDFAQFEIPFPDSLNWVLPYINGK